MKGFLEEYGAFVITVFVCFSILSFLLFSTMKPEGSFHKLTIDALESTGATVVDEWGSETSGMSD